MSHCFPTYGSGDQAIRRFAGGKQTTEVVAGSLPRPSDKPHYPLYLDARSFNGFALQVLLLESVEPLPQ